ncbi:MAG: phosphoribosylglycinamide formyltransferase, partial [Lachnospiraceae bacterium]|nr:phosphoribosylglycinamide formyltransferase [Lachnospiraceae bacterium]
MLKLAVLVSGGGTNLQAIIDAVKDHKLTDVSIEVVVSNKDDAYALKRAEDNGIPGVCIRPKDYE